jgi:hypothetical protein
MFDRANQRWAGFRKTPRYPVLVVAVMGFAGFLLDYLWKPISTSGLILLGLAVSPWLIRVIKLKKGKLGGWEFEVADVAAPASTGARLAEEIAEEAAEEPANPELPLPEPAQSQPLAPEASPVGNEGVAASQSVPSAADGNLALLSSHQNRVARAYLAEGLVFQELQREFGGFIQREVRLDSSEIDGIVVTSRGAIAVEVKLVKDLRNWQSRVMSAAYRLLSFREAAKGRYDNLSVLVAVVVDNKRTPFEMSRRLREFRGVYPELDVRIFFLPELLDKYGLSLQVDPMPQ